jgi:hypothetical protein
MRPFVDMFSTLDCAGALPHVDARDRLEQECGMSLLWAACQLILNNEAPQSPVAWLVGELLKKGANPSGRYENEQKTPLMYVAYGADTTPGALEAASMLLKAGADVNAIDMQGFSALMVCQEPDPDNQPRKCTSMAKLLIGAGADVALRSTYNRERNMGGVNAIQTAAHAYRVSGGQPHMVGLMEVLLSAPSSAAALSQRSFLWGTTAWQQVFDYSLSSGQPELPALTLLTHAMEKAGLSTQEDAKAVRLTRLLESLREASQRVCNDTPRHLWQTAAAASRQERAQLEKTLVAAGLPGNLEGALEQDPNPLLTLHTFLVTSILPRVCFKSFRREKDIPWQDEGMLLSLRGPLLDKPKTARISGYLHGEPVERHYVWHEFQAFQELIANPIRHSLGFAVPCEAAIAALLAHSPLLELGAGTGYWASLLRARGADVLAVDKHACSAENLENPFHSAAVPGAQVQVCDGVAAAAACPQRALVLMYPFKEGGAAWDAAALAAYAGDVVIHAGALAWRQPGSERAACKLETDDLFFDAESGDTTSRPFQEALRKGFTLQETVPLPRFPYSADTLTIWKRKAPGEDTSSLEGVCAEPAGCMCSICSAARGAGELCGWTACGARTTGAAPLLACACHPGAPGIAYCCTEHQSQDWAKHRSACKAARAALHQTSAARQNNSSSAACALSI